MWGEHSRKGHCHTQPQKTHTQLKAGTGASRYHENVAHSYFPGQPFPSTISFTNTVHTHHKVGISTTLPTKVSKVTLPLILFCCSISNLLISENQQSLISFEGACKLQIRKYYEYQVTWSINWTGFLFSG